MLPIKGVTAAVGLYRINLDYQEDSIWQEEI